MRQVVSAALVMAVLSVATALPPRQDEAVTRQHDTSKYTTTRHDNNSAISATTPLGLTTTPRPSSESPTTNTPTMEKVDGFPFRVSGNSTMTTTAVSISTPYTSVVPNVVVERASQEGSRKKESDEDLVLSLLQSSSDNGLHAGVVSTENEVSSTENSLNGVGLGRKGASISDSKMRSRIDLISSIEDDSDPVYRYSEELQRSKSEELPLLTLFDSFQDPKGPTDIVNSQLRSLKQYSTNEFRIPALSPATLNAIRNLGDASEENVLRPFLLRPNQHEEVAQLATTQSGSSRALSHMPHMGSESSSTGDSNYYTDEQNGYHFQDSLTEDLDYRNNLETRFKGVEIRTTNSNEQEDTPSDRFHKMVTALSRINPALYAGLRLPYYSLVSEEDDLNLLYRDSDSYDYSIYENGIPFYSKKVPSSDDFHQQQPFGPTVTDSRPEHTIRTTSQRPSQPQSRLKQDTDYLLRFSKASDPQTVQKSLLQQPQLPQRDKIGSFLTAFNRPQNETSTNAYINISSNEETATESASTTASPIENIFDTDNIDSSTIVNNVDFSLLTKNDEHLHGLSEEDNNTDITSIQSRRNFTDIITQSSNVEMSYAPPPRGEPLPASLPLISPENSGKYEYLEPSKEIPVYVDPNASIFGHKSAQKAAKPLESEHSNTNGHNEYRGNDYDYYEEYYDYNIATPISVSRSLALDSYPPNDFVSTMSTIFAKDLGHDLGKTKNSHIRQNPLFLTATSKENQQIGGTYYDEVGNKHSVNGFPTNSRNIFQPHLHNIASSNGREGGQNQASQFPTHGRIQDIGTNTSPNSHHVVGPIAHFATTHPSNVVTEATDALSSYSSYTYESILDELLATTPENLDVNTLLAPVTARPQTDQSRLFGEDTSNSQHKDINSGKDFHSQKLDSNEGFIDSNSRGEFGLENESNKFQASLSSDDPSAFTPVIPAEASTVRNPIVTQFSTPLPIPKPPLLTIRDDPNLQYLNLPNPPSQLIRLSQHPKSFLPFPYPKPQFPHLTENSLATPSPNLGINPLVFDSQQSTPNTFLTNSATGNHVGLEYHENIKGITFTPEAESNHGLMTQSASSDIPLSATAPTPHLDSTLIHFSSPFAATTSTISIDAVTGIELLKNNFSDDYYETSESKAIFPSEIPIAYSNQDVLSQRDSFLHHAAEGLQYSEPGGLESSFSLGSSLNLDHDLIKDNINLAGSSPISHHQQNLDQSLEIQSNVPSYHSNTNPSNIFVNGHSNIHTDKGNILQQSSTNGQLVNTVREHTLTATATEQSTDKLNHKHFDVAAGEHGQFSSNPPETINTFFGTTASQQDPRYFNYPGQFMSNNGHIDASRLPVYPSPLYPSGPGGFVSPHTFGQDISGINNYPLQQEQFYYQRPIPSMHHHAILPPRQQPNGYANNYYLGIPPPNSPFYNLQNPMLSAASFNSPYHHNLNPSLHPYQLNYAKQLHPLSFHPSSSPNAQIGDHLISQSLHFNDDISTSSNKENDISKTKIESLPIRSLKEIIIDDQGRLVQETFYEDNIFEDGDDLNNLNVELFDDQDYEQDNKVTSGAPNNITTKVQQEESDSNHGKEQSKQLQTLISQTTSSPIPTTFRPSTSFLDTSSQSSPWVPISPITQVEGKSVIQTNTPDTFKEIFETTTASSISSSTNSQASLNFIDDFIAVTPVGTNGLVRPTTTQTTPKVNLSTIAELVRPTDKPINNEISAFTTLREALRGIAHHPSYFILPNEDIRNSSSTLNGEPTGKILLNGNSVSGNTPNTREFVLILSENDLGILPNAGDYRIVLPDTFSDLESMEEFAVAESALSKQVTQSNSKERLSQITQDILQGKDNVDLNFLKGQSSVGQVYAGKIELQQQTGNKDAVSSEKSIDGTEPQKEIDIDGADAIEINDVIKFLELNLGKLADESREMLRQRFKQGNEEIHLDTPIYLWRPGFKDGFGIRLLDNMHFVIPNIPENYGKPVPIHEIPESLGKSQMSTREQPVAIKNSDTTFGEELKNTTEDSESVNIINSIRQEIVNDLDEARVPPEDLYQYDYTGSGSNYYEYDYENTYTDTNTKQSLTGELDGSTINKEAVVKDHEEKILQGIEKENSSNPPKQKKLSASSATTGATDRPIGISTVSYIMPSVADNFVSELEKLFQFASSNTNLQVAAPDTVKIPSKIDRDKTSPNRRDPSINTLKNEETSSQPNDPFNELIKSTNHSIHFFSSPEILNNIVNLTSQNNLTYINQDNYNSDLNLGIKGLPSSLPFIDTNPNESSPANVVKSMTSSELRDWNNALKFGVDNLSNRQQNANSQVLKLHEQILFFSDDEDESSTSQSLVIDPSKSNNQIFVSSNAHMSPFPVFDEKFFTQESSKHIVQLKKESENPIQNSFPVDSSQLYFLPDSNVQIPSSAAEYFEKQRESKDFNSTSTTTLSSHNLASESLDPMQNTLKLLNLKMQQITKPLFVPASNQEPQSVSNLGPVQEKMQNELLNYEIGWGGRPIESQITKIPIQSSTESTLFFVPNIIPSNRKEVQTNLNENSKRDWLWDTDFEDHSNQSEVEAIVTNFHASDFVPVSGPFGSRELFVPSKLTREQLDLLLAGGLEASAESEEILLSSSSENRPATINRPVEKIPEVKPSNHQGVHRVMKLSEVLQQHPEVLEVSHETKSSAPVFTDNKSKSLNPLGGSTRDGWRWYARNPERSGSAVGDFNDTSGVKRQTNNEKSFIRGFHSADRRTTVAG